MTLNRIATAIALLSASVGMGASGFSVYAHQRAEQTYEVRRTLAGASETPGTLPNSMRLGYTRLFAGTHAEFEVCADDGFSLARWQNRVAFAVWQRSPRELMSQRELTPEVLANVRRNSQWGCLAVGRGEVPASGQFSVEVGWDAPVTGLEDVVLVPRIVSQRRIQPTDRYALWLLWAGMFGCVCLAWINQSESSALASGGDDEPMLQAFRTRLSGARRLGMGAGAFAVGMGLAAFFPVGAVGGLESGLWIGLVQAVVAGWLVDAPEGRALALGWRRPKRHAWLWLVIGPLLVYTLLAFAAWTTRHVPSTSESAVQLFLAQHSGLLSFAALAAIVPVAEELFFRGFVWSCLVKYTRWLAFLGAWLLFVVAHLPQTYGQWGALVAIAMTGLVLTAVRALSGSVLVAALVHLMYNGWLALSAVGT